MPTCAHPRVMRPGVRKSIFAAVGLGLVLVCGAYALQRPCRQYPGAEYFDFPLPPDYMVPGEWTFARLMYPTIRPGYGWLNGGSDWTIDYPRSDRHLSEAVR